MIISSTTRSKQNSEKVSEAHLNKPQILNQIIGSSRTTAIAGRAVGKTHGITSVTLFDWCEAMPRSVIRLACYTYEGLKMNVLPGIIKAWKVIYGYEEGVHFWVGKLPPKNILVQKPYRDPKGDPKHIVFW